MIMVFSVNSQLLLGLIGNNNKELYVAVKDNIISKHQADIGV